MITITIMITQKMQLITIDYDYNRNQPQPRCSLENMKYSMLNFSPCMYCTCIHVYVHVQSRVQVCTVYVYLCC